MKRKFVTFNSNRKLGRRSLMVKRKQDLQKQNQFSFYYNDVRTPEGEQMVYAVYLQEVTDEQRQALIDGGMRYTGRFRARGVLFHEFVLPDTELHYQKKETAIKLMDSPLRVVENLKQNPGTEGYLNLDEFNSVLAHWDLGQVNDSADGYFMRWNGEAWDISEESFSVGTD